MRTPESRLPPWTYFVIFWWPSPVLSWPGVVLSEISCCPGIQRTQILALTVSQVSPTRPNPLTRRTGLIQSLGIIAHICVMHLELRQQANGNRITTFYDELSIPEPHLEQEDMVAIKSWALAAVHARKKELGQHYRHADNKRLLGFLGGGGTLAASAENKELHDARLFVLMLMYDILSVDQTRGVYNRVFMPGLKGYWPGPLAFLQKTCMWDKETE